MRIFFTYSWGDSALTVNKNFINAKAVFPNILKIKGRESIIDTYYYLSSLSDENFIWIDSDNEVMPDALKIFECTSPSILMTTNEFNITYGHGGIKLCSPFKYIRPEAIDVTYYLGLTPVNVIGSFHSLGEGWLKYRSIFVEMIKCALKGDTWILSQWKNCRPDIWNNVEDLLTTSTIETIISLIRDRKIFKYYYENNLRLNLQE